MSAPVRPEVVYRPESAVFWVFVAALIAGTLGLLSGFGTAFAETRDAHLELAPWWLLFMAALVWLMLRFDPYRGMRRYPQALAAGAALGGTAALAMSATGNAALTTVWASVLDADTLARWSAALTAPIIEEAAKLACAAVILTLCAAICTRVGQALLVGMFVGFGFDVVEDLVYASSQALSSLDSDVSGARTQLILRAFTSVPAHWAFTGLTTAGLMLLLPWCTSVTGWSPSRRFGTALGLLAAGPLLHFIWNSPAPEEPGAAMLVMAGKIVVNLAVFLVVTRALLRGERGRVTARIAAGGPALDAFEPSVLASLETGRARRALRRNAKRDGGRRAARAVARAQRDALDALQT